jgi:hypothetical protein
MNPHNAFKRPSAVGQNATATDIGTVPEIDARIRWIEFLQQDARDQRDREGVAIYRVQLQELLDLRTKRASHNAVAPGPVLQRSSRPAVERDRVELRPFAEI